MPWASKRQADPCTCKYHEPVTFSPDQSFQMVSVSRKCRYGVQIRDQHLGMKRKQTQGRESVMLSWHSFSDLPVEDDMTQSGEAWKVAHLRPPYRVEYLVRWLSAVYSLYRRTGGSPLWRARVDYLVTASNEWMNEMMHYSHPQNCGHYTLWYVPDWT